jgi:hypothetical protein
VPFIFLYISSTRSHSVAFNLPNEMLFQLKLKLSRIYCADELLEIWRKKLKSLNTLGHICKQNLFHIVPAKLSHRLITNITRCHKFTVLTAQAYRYTPLNVSIYIRMNILDKVPKNEQEIEEE